MKKYHGIGDDGEEMVFKVETKKTRETINL